MVKHTIELTKLEHEEYVRLRERFDECVKDEVDSMVLLKKERNWFIKSLEFGIFIGFAIGFWTLISICRL